MRSLLKQVEMVCVFQEDPSVACGAIGLCQSMQAALAKLRVQQNEQLLSNEIPKVDLAQNETPFLLNVPMLLYPQNTKDETPKQETPKEVRPSIVTFLLEWGCCLLVLRACV